MYRYYVSIVLVGWMSMNPSFGGEEEILSSDEKASILALCHELAQTEIIPEIRLIESSVTAHPEVYEINEIQNQMISEIVNIIQKAQSNPVQKLKRMNSCEIGLLEKKEVLVTTGVGCTLGCFFLTGEVAQNDWISALCLGAAAGIIFGSTNVLVQKIPLPTHFQPLAKNLTRGCISTLVSCFGNLTYCFAIDRALQPGSNVNVIVIHSIVKFLGTLSTTFLANALLDQPIDWTIWFGLILAGVTCAVQTSAPFFQAPSLN